MTIPRVTRTSRTREALLLEKGYVIPLYEYTRTWQLRDHLAGLAADHMGGYWLGGIQRVN